MSAFRTPANGMPKSLSPLLKRSPERPDLNEIPLEFQDESQQVITKIGSKTVGKGEFWTYALNKTNNLDDPMYVQTVKDGDTIVIYVDTVSSKD